MTRNQIDAQNMRETAYHNREMERQGRHTISENIRHNKAFETETNRHNVQTEVETHRYNTNINRTNWASINESARHNQMSEQLQKQSNELNYQSKIYAADQARLSAQDVARINAQTQASVARLNSETSRLNAQLSASTSRYNTAQTNKVNLAMNKHTNAVSRANTKETNQTRKWTNVNDNITRWGDVLSKVLPKSGKSLSMPTRGRNKKSSTVKSGTYWRVNPYSANRQLTK